MYLSPYLCYPNMKGDSMDFSYIVKKNMEKYKKEEQTLCNVLNIKDKNKIREITYKRAMLGLDFQESVKIFKNVYINYLL